ncbi:hypothetical protein POM88_021360 [Heracleum sosnowskyi]|uniref:Reverse transcriptase zinc-binding domain-containing protein n=1 Tax=Heracleum sosnowskyi TaxID=360622 RepID=A0AAD8MNU5_9APIA|nr:hypothetical protein POM88_021360 [Heracleum sosnowskyi]
MILDWWDFHHRHLLKDLKDTWDAVHCFKEEELKSVCKLVLIATLWTLWLNRNQRVFNNTEVRIEGVVMLVKLRSQEWAVATKKILQEVTKWWDVNPVGAVT